MKWAFLAFAAVLLAACEPRIRTEVIDVPCMGVGYIYQWDTVQAYLGKTDPNRIRLSASYQAKGEKLEESNPQGALMAYKRAIALSPDAEGYLNLVRFLEKTENDLELMRVLEFLVEGIEPDSELGKGLEKERKELTLALLISYLNNKYKTYDEVFFSFEEQGWPRKELVKAFEKDERIRMDKQSLEFYAVLFNLGDEEYREEMLKSGKVMELLLASLPQVADSVKIGERELASFQYNSSEEDYYTELYDPKIMFYRGLPFTYEYHFKYTLYSRVLLNSADEIGLLYALDSSKSRLKPEERNVAYYFTAVNKENYRMSEPVCVAWQTPDTLVTCSLSSHNLWQEKFAKVWDRGYQPGSKTNKLLRMEPVDQVRLYIGESDKSIF